jgi:hypothetical protein
MSALSGASAFHTPLDTWLFNDGGPRLSSETRARITIKTDGQTMSGNALAALQDLVEPAASTEGS